MDGVIGFEYAFLTAIEGIIIYKGRYIVNMNLESRPSAVYLIDTGNEINMVRYIPVDGSENEAIIDEMITEAVYEQ